MEFFRRGREHAPRVSYNQTGLPVDGLGCGRWAYGCTVGISLLVAVGFVVFMSPECTAFREGLDKLSTAPSSERSVPVIPTQIPFIPR
jgi:hypothetical protein